MATNKALKEALLKKLGGISPQALSARVQVKKNVLPITTEDAVYLIAFEAGLKIDRYLADDKVAEIRHLHSQAIGAQNNGNAATTRPKRRSTAGSDGNVREIRFPNEFKVTDPLLPTSKINQAKAMTAIYPLLYVLENSIRELIQRVMSSSFGADWWDTQLNSGKLKELKNKASSRMKTETKNSWHQKVGAHPIDYVDLGDLETIIRGKKTLFHPAIISDWDWFLHFMKELYPSRNVVCHMNPLLSDNVKDVRLKMAKWQRLVKGALKNIPK